MALGILDRAHSAINKLVGNKPTDTNKSSELTNAKIATLLDQSYKPINTNWYKAAPYGFKFTDRNNKQHWIFLPISPSNLMITTHYSTNVIATAYGTVEEHSEQRYFDIVIEGTTGISPKYVNVAESPSIPQLTGRQVFATSSVFDSIKEFGLFSKTIGTVERMVNKATDIVENLSDTQKPNVSGIDVSRTGYAAFHNLYRFFLLYKKNMSGEINSNTAVGMAPLIFFNYKDNNKYSCSIQKFVLRRTAENPMLYFYSIVLRAYKVAATDDDSIENVLRGRLEDLGLDGIRNSSILGTVKNVANSARQIIGAIAGGINILGR